MSTTSGAIFVRACTLWQRRSRCSPLRGPTLGPARPPGQSLAVAGMTRTGSPIIEPMADVKPQLILLPGMGTDRRLFRLQVAALPNLFIPAWIEPHDREPLTVYAERFARSLDPGGACFVGGASFGGIVALEMAAHLHAQGCFLVASIRSPRELPWLYWALRPVARMEPRQLGRVAACVARWLSPYLPPDMAGALRRLSHPRSEFLRWATWAALNWRPSQGTRQVPVYQIHGAADRTLPVKYTRPDIVVPGAGHLLPLTHAKIVNDFILERIGAPAAGAPGA
jgi:pimeloyl-ACP methyl ester carboxylesterase